MGAQQPYCHYFCKLSAIAQGRPIQCHLYKECCQTIRHLLAEKRTIHGTLHIFFRNKSFLFVKIESCEIFSICLIEDFVKPCKISAHSDKHSDDIFLWGIRVVQMNWNFVRFHEIINQRDAEHFRFLSWQTKKFYS